METVISNLREALDRLQSHVPYHQNGEIEGEHETYLFKLALERLIVEGRAIEEKFGV